MLWSILYAFSPLLLTPIINSTSVPEPSPLLDTCLPTGLPSISPAACRIIFSKKKKSHCIFISACPPRLQNPSTLSWPASSVSYTLITWNLWRFSEDIMTFGICVYSDMGLFIPELSPLSLPDWEHLTMTQSFPPQNHQARPRFAHTSSMGPLMPHYSPMQLVILWPMWFSSVYTYIWL